LAGEAVVSTGTATSRRRARISLFFLYTATLVMRAAAFMTIAVVTSAKYQESISYLTAGILVSFYPIAELITVMYFGVLCDKVGRKPILIFAHAITAVATFSFSTTNFIYPLFVFTALYGIGAAAKTSSTLTMIADLATPRNRARLMALFDIVTFLGLAGGYMLGFLLLNFYGVPPVTLFYLQTAAILISVVMVWLFVDETREKSGLAVRGWVALKSVVARKELRDLLPVYIPVIAIYGMVISFLEKIVEEADIIGDPNLMIILVVLGLSLVASMVVNAWLSDRMRKRRPFMLFGLFFFGVLAVLLVQNLENLSGLVAIWPVVVLVSLGAGAFPPAVLAYLADITKKETSGTAFGIYSLVLGFGFAFGPPMGGVVLETFGLPGFLVLIGAFLAVAGVGAFRLKEQN